VKQSIRYLVKLRMLKQNLHRPIKSVYGLLDLEWFNGDIALVEQTAKIGFTMKEISADKGYLGATNMLASLQKGAIPYIPFKSNSVPHSSGSYGAKSELWTRMFHFYSLHRAEFLQHYHKRSNIETTFHMIKSKFGQRLRSKSLTAQINEALCKVLCHNLCVVIQSMHELNITPEFQSAA
jgi:transposase